MKLCVSNAALSAFYHPRQLASLRALGIEGVEIAPGRAWPGDITAAAVEAYGASIHSAGLAVAGMHELFWEHPDLGLFAEGTARRNALAHLAHLSAACRDLGGRTLILGRRPRPRGLPLKDAWMKARAFLEDLLPQIEPHGTVLCFSPLAPSSDEFCATARDCRTLALALNHRALGFHLSAAALAAAGETGHATFAALGGRLAHFHADEPERRADGAAVRVDHGDLRCHLEAIGYSRWISLVRKAAPFADPLDALREAARLAAERYLRADAPR